MEEEILSIRKKRKDRFSHPLISRIPNPNSHFIPPSEEEEEGWN